MSDVVKAAEAAVQEARQDSAALELVAALLAAQTAAQASVAQHGGCGCPSHGHGPQNGSWSAGKVLAVAGAGCAAAMVLTGMFLAVALTAAAVGVSAVVMLFIVREIRKGSK